MSSFVLNLHNVSFIRDRKTILKDILWTIQQGEHWALIGQNGSGKTSLLKIITGYEWPTSGGVEVLGKKFGEVDVRELRKQIGWVSSDLQERLQQGFTVEEVVLSGYEATIGLDSRIKAGHKKLQNKAIDLMRLMGVDHLSHELFPVLSHGEQKRVLIARALMHDPRLLILDEPCSGLDLKAREEFLPFIEQLGLKKEGPTIIMTTHHVEEIMPVITHVSALKSGRLICADKKDTIFKKEILQEVFDIELTIYQKQQRYWIHRN